MSQKRILLIDDETNLSTVIQACLEKVGGWIVLKADTGRAGLHIAATETPDAILLDVRMPDMDGFTVLQHLQEMPTTRTIPVILLTAQVNGVQSALYAQLPIAGVIAKPFNPMRLSSQIDEILASV
jgi:CheY-like chemotaxis protein